MSRPLEGMRIVDLTHMLAGPFATHQLSLLGADVIKVEPPGRGDAVRWGKDRTGLGLADNFVAINAGKRSAAIDLKRPDGRRAILDLCRGADAVVENFRAGVMDELGLGHAAVSEINPRIVYCSISGYGQNGPLRDRPAYDHVVQAVTGMAVMNGDGDAEPIKVGFPAVDTATGMTASNAILAALLRRERTGQGQFIDVSMVGAAALLMYTMVTHALASGTEPARTGNRGFTGSPGCDTFGTADGHVATGANTPAQFRRLCEILGVSAMLTDAELFDERMRGGADSGFATCRDPVTVRARLSRAFMNRSAAVWEQALNDASIPAARVRTVGEFTRTALAAMPGAIVEVPAMPGHPEGARTLGIGYHTQADPAALTSGAARLGEHTIEVLAGIGYEADTIRAMIEAGVIAQAKIPVAAA